MLLLLLSGLLAAKLRFYTAANVCGYSSHCSAKVMYSCGRKARLEKNVVALWHSCLMAFASSIYAQAFFFRESNSPFLSDTAGEKVGRMETESVQ